MGKKLTVAYLRLSQDDADKKEEYSHSIYNQSALIKSFAKGMGLKINKEYIDDGFSGTNFERPGFEKLREDVESGIVGIVITKDMSRLGRNFLDTAYYISEYFPKNEVRYIAINDNFDSDNPNSSEQEMMMNFRSLINDRYAKDTSVKRKQVAETKTNEGQYIGFIAPYGYKIKKIGNNRTLEIDDYSSKIVKRIFTEIASGKTRKEVAEGLNKDKIIPPVIYMRMTPSKNKKYYYDWSDKIVYRIIRNKTYTGRIVIRKSKKDNHYQKKREYISVKDRKTIDNCHPLIINDSLFEEANRMLKELKPRSLNDYYGLFSGLVICGECGRKMTACRVIKENGNIKYHFACTRVENRKPCSNRTIADSKLRTIIENNLRELINCYVEEKDVAKIATKNFIRAKRPNEKIANIKDEIEFRNISIKNLYIKKASGEISFDEFIAQKQKETELKEEAENMLKEIIELKDENLRKEELLEKYNAFINEDILINSIVRELIKEIVVYKDNTIKLVFKFGLGDPKKIQLF